MWRGVFGRHFVLAFHLPEYLTILRSRGICTVVQSARQPDVSDKWSENGKVVRDSATLSIKVSSETNNESLEESRVLPLFPTFVWLVRLSEDHRNPINEAISHRLADMMAAMPFHPPGKLLQTDQNMDEDPAFADLIPHIISASQGCLEFMKVRYQSFQITGCWANVASAGMAHSQHSHPNNYLSGVYYVKVPKGGDAITFHDPRSQPNIFMPPTRELTTENAGTMSIGIKAGTLVMFPSWLEHSVPPNSSAEQRISVAFNIMFSDFENSMSPPLWEGNL